MNPENEKKLIIDEPDDGNTSGLPTENRYRLEVKTGKTSSGGNNTQRIFLEVDWPDITNVPIISCIDGGNANTTNWGTLQNN
jgi:hypothetical protein